MQPPRARPAAAPCFPFFMFLFQSAGRRRRKANTGRTSLVDTFTLQTTWPGAGRRNRRSRPRSRPPRLSAPAPPHISQAPASAGGSGLGPGSEEGNARAVSPAAFRGPLVWVGANWLARLWLHLAKVGGCRCIGLVQPTHHSQTNTFRRPSSSHRDAPLCDHRRAILPRGSFRGSFVAGGLVKIDPQRRAPPGYRVAQRRQQKPTPPTLRATAAGAHSSLRLRLASNWRRFIVWERAPAPAQPRQGSGRAAPGLPEPGHRPG